MYKNFAGYYVSSRGTQLNVCAHMLMRVLEHAWAMDERMDYVGIVAICCQMLKLRGSFPLLILLCFSETKSCSVT